MLQDNLKLYGRYPFPIIKCPSCSRTHNFKKCPFIHYVPDIDLLLKRLNFKLINNRNQNFIRKIPKNNIHSLKNLSTVQISQKRFEIAKLITSEKEKDDSNSDNSVSEEEIKTSNKKTSISYIKGFGRFRNNSRSSSIYRRMQRQTVGKKSEEDEKERESLSSIEDLPEKEKNRKDKNSLDESPKFNILLSNSLEEEEETHLNTLNVAGVGNFGMLSNEINSAGNNRNSVLNASNGQNLINHEKKNLVMKREIKRKYFDMFMYDFEGGRDFSEYFLKNNRSEVLMALKSSLKNSGRKSPQKKKKDPLKTSIF